MKTIAVYVHKGGVGKTVTTANMAYNLSGMGYRVLMVDMDPQGNLSSFFRRYDLNRPSVKELLTGQQAPSRCIRRTSFKGLDIIPANFQLRELTVSALAQGLQTLSLVQKRYADRYDYCLIDCPPSVDFLIEIIMAAADDVIIPLKPDRFSSDGLETVLDVIRDFGEGRVTAGCLFTQFYQNRDSLKAISQVLSTQTVPVYDSVIRRSSAVDHSISVRRPLMKCASKATATMDYMDFTEEYLEKEVEENGIIDQHC